MPRNIASVPSVTTSDGRPRQVTSTPLKAPSAAPASSTSGIAAASGTPAWTSTPRMTLVSARMLATERSISRAMISSTIGSTSSAFSETPAAAWDRLKAVVKFGTASAA